MWKRLVLFLGSNPEDAQFSQVNSQNTGDIYVVMKSGANTQKFMEQIEKQKEKYT